MKQTVGSTTYGPVHPILWDAAGPQQTSLRENHSSTLFPVLEWRTPTCKPISGRRYGGMAIFFQIPRLGQSCTYTACRGRFELSFPEWGIWRESGAGHLGPELQAEITSRQGHLAFKPCPDSCTLHTSLGAACCMQMSDRTMSQQSQWASLMLMYSCCGLSRVASRHATVGNAILNESPYPLKGDLEDDLGRLP